MPKHNAANTRIKREYFDYLKQAQGRDVSSIDQVASAIARFEAATGHKDFKKFHRQQAAAFKALLILQMPPSVFRLALGVFHPDNRQRLKSPMARSVFLPSGCFRVAALIRSGSTPDRKPFCFAL